MIIFLIILNLFSIYHQMFIILFNLLDWKGVFLCYALELIMVCQTFILPLLSIIRENMTCLFITFWLIIDNIFLKLKYFISFQPFIFIFFLNLLFIIRYLVICNSVHFELFLFIHLIHYCYWLACSIKHKHLNVQLLHKFSLFTLHLFMKHDHH